MTPPSAAIGVNGLQLGERDPGGRSANATEGRSNAPGEDTVCGLRPVGAELGISGDVGTGARPRYHRPRLDSTYLP
jgi:hypothetical protein